VVAESISGDEASGSEGNNEVFGKRKGSSSSKSFGKLIRFEFSRLEGVEMANE
jgi:hypothetical protein